MYTYITLVVISDWLRLRTSVLWAGQSFLLANLCNSRSVTQNLYMRQQNQHDDVREIITFPAHILLIWNKKKKNVFPFFFFFVKLIIIRTSKSSPVGSVILWQFKVRLKSTGRGRLKI